MKDILGMTFLFSVALVVVFADIVYSDSRISRRPTRQVTLPDGRQLTVQKSEEPFTLVAGGRFYTVETNGFVHLQGTNLNEKGEALYDEN